MINGASLSIGGREAPAFLMDVARMRETGCTACRRCAVCAATQRKIAGASPVRETKVKAGPSRARLLIQAVGKAASGRRLRACPCEKTGLRNPQTGLPFICSYRLIS